MTFNEYKIINLDDFVASGLVSKEVELVLDGIGLRTIMVTQGRLVSLVYEDVILSIGITEKNPFIFGEHEVWVDENNDVWLGFLVSA